MKRILITTIRVLFTLIALSTPFYIIGTFVSWQINPLKWLAFTTATGRFFSMIPLSLILIIAIVANMRVWKKESLKGEDLPVIPPTPYKSKWQQKLDEMQAVQKERNK